VLKYAHKINNFSSLNLTKLDVLDKLDEIKIGVSYKIDGREINYIPGTLEELAGVKVDYETMPGWKSDISKINDYSKLP